MKRTSNLGNAGELHILADGKHPALTTNQGLEIADNQNTLKAFLNGPILLEDFIFREKITHFDHERIPERIVHARGSAAHGFFELTHSLEEYTTANILTEVGKKISVFCRLSTVAGGAGSVDTPRDVRGFSVKFYTNQGNWDLVGNNIPVFFIQDPIKFPDLVHSLKMEPDRGFPQAGSAHDTFWDFISLMPESMHMVIWAMSDRTLPRSLRMMEGFGVHSFKLINKKGQYTFAKFHWRPELGLQSTLWDEAVKLQGADNDYHRRDLYEAIANEDYPSWVLAVQLFTEKDAEAFPFDHLDPTKLIPEELVPLTTIGRMVLNRNPDNHFAENEQVAFCPANILPGMDFSDDPLLQGRLFSYLDTQLSRLGGPNFNQIPINAPKCPFHNMQTDGLMQMQVPKTRIMYEPNSLGESEPKESTSGFTSSGSECIGKKNRLRPDSFADHYSQAQLFYRSQTASEQKHIQNAFVFELSKVSVDDIRERVLSHLDCISEALANSVREALGYEARAPKNEEIPFESSLLKSKALSIHLNMKPTLRGRCVGILVADGSDADLLKELCNQINSAEGKFKLIGSKIAGVTLSNRQKQKVDGHLDSMPSVLFDAVVVLLSKEKVSELSEHPVFHNYIRDAYLHLKAIGFNSESAEVIHNFIPKKDHAIVNIENDCKEFIYHAQRRLWEREH